MCLIVFAWRPGHAQPLVVAANRDEFYARPARPLAQWVDAPHVYAGRDLEAGGTWLGVGANGRFAALTNIREPHTPPTRRSRGDLVARFLSGNQSTEEYLNDVSQQSVNYAGFNLLVGTRNELWHFNSRDVVPIRLNSGVYGLSNAGLDTPWPKLVKARAALGDVLNEPDPQALLAILEDRQTASFSDLPDTGVGLERERVLSSMFIKSPNYGSRCSTVVLIDRNNHLLFSERVYDLTTFAHTTRTFEFDIAQASHEG